MFAPYISQHRSVQVIMAEVLLALTPGIVISVYLFGSGLLIQLSIATVVAYLTEIVCLLCRKKPAPFFACDLSAIVTAWLLAVSIPPLSPWWLTALATLFAITFGKHAYGGLGQNPFNPAMVGYVFMLIAFPSWMTHWLSATHPHPSFLSYLRWIFTSSGLSLDAVTSASVLDYLRTQLYDNQTITQALAHSSGQFGLFAGRGYDNVALGYCGGGLWLAYRRIIPWRLPCSFLGALALLATFFWLVDRTRYMPPLYHLFAGASMLGAWFIITDPVSGSTTPRGQLIFGVSTAVLTYCIRVFGGYPDGLAFAVLLMNMGVPLIDRYTQPRVFGYHDDRHHK